MSDEGEYRVTHPAVVRHLGLKVTLLVVASAVIFAGFVAYVAWARGAFRAVQTLTLVAESVPASPEQVGLFTLAQRDLDAMKRGEELLAKRLPVWEEKGGKIDMYYWYYATQVMHNLQGAEWDAWNRQIRAVLIQSQATEGCAKGSWDPLLPSKDPWAEPGGRLLVTSLNCLTLQVYYRYLPLYRTDEGQERQKP